MHDGLMRVLVLGGTAFVGRAVVEAALACGWQVTTFNRGQTGEDVPRVEPVRGDRHDPRAVAGLATNGPWDAVIDTSGYVPRNVLDVASTLAPQAGRYVFVSTVSAYEGWPTEPLTEASAVLPCPPDAGPDYGIDTEDGPTKYGYQKAGCEAAAVKAFGTSRVVVLRPGVVLGPREYVGRLPWWLRRVARGGSVIAPGTPDRTIQPVDVRDVADFVVSSSSRDLNGAYNLTGPARRDTFGGLLAACADATGGNAEFVWTADEVLVAHGVRQWSEMPLWRTAQGVWAVDSARAASEGLHCRPLAETVRDTWAWMQSGGDLGDHERNGEIGLSADHERELLSAVARVRHYS